MNQLILKNFTGLHFLAYWFLDFSPGVGIILSWLQALVLKIQVILVDLSGNVDTGIPETAD